MNENQTTPASSTIPKPNADKPSAKPFAEVAVGSVVRFGFADGVEVHAIVLACDATTGEAKLKVLPPPPNNPKKPRAAIEIREGVKFAKDLQLKDEKDKDKVLFAVGYWSR